MSYVIAMAGKGGTGKTTAVALIVRLIKENSTGSILGVDADPNSNLAEALGLEAKETVGSLLDWIAAHPDEIPSGMSKDRFIEYRVQSIIAEGDGFDVLTMGKPEGPGCYCYVNNALRGIMAKLIRDYDFVVIDNEAGLEHLSRRTTRSADALVVVSDATKIGLRSAQRIDELAKELDIKIRRRMLIINRSSAMPDNWLPADSGLQYIGNIPVDEQIEKVSLNGGSLMKLSADAVGLQALRQLGEKIWQSS